MSVEHASSPVERDAQRIRELMRIGRHEDAVAAAQALAGQVPNNRDVLYLTAINLRFLKRVPEALDVLAQLELAHPRYSRLYQERGECYVVLKDAPRAIEAFLRGVNINPALPASWSMLTGLYRLTGDTNNAAMAAAHVTKLRQLPAEVLQASSLFADGEVAPAEAVVRAFLLSHGDHIEAMRLLARIGDVRDSLDDAELLLEAVLRLAPDYRAARADYAGVLLKRQKHMQAREQLRQLMQLEPDNREYLKKYGAACIGLGDYEPIIGLYRRLLQDATDVEDVSDLHLWIAHSLKTLGNQWEAIEEYRASLAARPSFGEAWWSLANLKTYRFSDADIDLMRDREAAPDTPTVDRYHLCFALGKALEDRGRFADSWSYYERGNALKHAEIRYLPRINEINTRLQKATCTADFFAARREWGASDPDPIFIVGLPRSGSTLVEQILASHSEVEGTQELADIQRIVMELRDRAADLENPRFPGVLAELTAEDLRKLGERYMADTRAYRRSGRPFFIDKMPNNFRYIGLIRLMLPNAKIIDARREPMACCFGNLKQLFSSGQEFSYSVEDIARYYRTYLELMRHWNATLPGAILTVQHEDVVDDLEQSVRRVLDFCGLSFEPACLKFHNTERSIRTASSEQVRQPIFRGGLEQWKSYEPWLGKLKECLGDARMHYRD